jgi:hypothetical protein
MGRDVLVGVAFEMSLYMFTQFVPEPDERTIGVPTEPPTPAKIS